MGHSWHHPLLCLPLAFALFQQFLWQLDGLAENSWGSFSFNLLAKSFLFMIEFSYTNYYKPFPLSLQSSPLHALQLPLQSCLLLMPRQPLLPISPCITCMEGNTVHNRIPIIHFPDIYWFIQMFSFLYNMTEVYICGLKTPRVRGFYAISN